MPPTYQNISEADMDAYLGGLGFKKITVPPVKGKIVREKVYAKRCDTRGFQLSLRIYSSIEGGKGRKVGGDAIKCEMMWRAVPKTNEETDEEAYLIDVGRSVRVHRTQGWKENLKKRLDKLEDMLGPPCPRCGSPMVVRKNSKDNSEFYGCSTYKLGWCKATMPFNPHGTSK